MRKVDWNSKKVVVFESDDWGFCEFFPDIEAHDKLLSHSFLKKHWEETSYIRWAHGTLEKGKDLEKLFDILLSFKGRDGKPVSFTPFYVLANPDFKAIRDNNFTSYVDIELNKGVAGRWKREGYISKAREGIRSGVWHPEYHARLHHLNAVTWLELLRAPQNEENFSRLCFDEEVCVSKGQHIPEYNGMNIRQQYAWARKGVETFFTTFDFYPKCGINSDAIPGTEEVWSLLGMEVRALKACVADDGRRVPPSKHKPNSTMDTDNEMGAYNQFLDLVYLNRNVWFEPVVGVDETSVEQTCKVILRAWENNEPAIVSTHRINYVSLFQEKADEGLTKLRELLCLLSRHEPLYRSSYEVAQGYKTGEIGP